MKKIYFVFVAFLLALFAPIVSAQSSQSYIGPDGGVLVFRIGQGDDVYYKSSDFLSMTAKDFAHIATDLIVEEKITEKQFISMFADFILTKVPNLDNNKMEQLSNEIQQHASQYVQTLIENYDEFDFSDDDNYSLWSDPQELYDWARQYGLTTITNIDNMRFGDTITREEAAAFIKRSIDKGIFPAPTNTVTYNSFRDAHKIAPEFQDNISYLQKYGIFKGDARGNFRPKAKISVQEVIILAMRLYSFEKNLSDKYYVEKFSDITGVHYDDLLASASTRYVMLDIIKELFDAK